MALVAVAEALAGKAPEGESVTVRGWARSRRDSKGGFSFIHLNDGSCFDSIQIVAPGTLPNYSSEVLKVTAAYEARAILGPRYRNDLLHIGLATVAAVDVLVSWNFRHIVRVDKIQLFNAVNGELGYGPLTIYSPREVTTYGRDESDSSS